MNYQRAVSVSRFILILLCIALLLSIAVLGYDVGEHSSDGIFEEGTIRLGLDLAGGSVLTYQAETDDSGAKLAEGMDSVLQVMRQRLDSIGLTEALVYLVGDDMITAEIPSVEDPAEAAKTLMATAKLTFKDADGNVVLGGSDVDSASPHYGVLDSKKGTSEYFVELNLTDEGSKKFAEATKKARNAATVEKQTITICMDNNPISSPHVDPRNVGPEGITGGKATISGNFTDESAKALAGQINAGALKYTLKNVDQHTIGATLGDRSLTTSLKAGAIGIVFVMLFMILYYRVPGIMASISLIGFMSLFMIALILTQANLTLPGIAGIILTIGMAVDANVVIFERVKEEIRLGKSAKAAVKAGHHNALSAVIDSNVTTIIASGVLYFLGTGTIKGFATTLFMGVIISLFTSIYLTRWLLNLGIDMGMSNISLYGVKKESVQNA